MSDEGKSYKKFFVAACVVLLIGLAVIAIAEPIAFSKANAEYPMGQWAWNPEYRSYIYETTSANIKTIGIILSIVGVAGILLVPLIQSKSQDG
jgi:hypothetical protein